MKKVSILVPCYNEEKSLPLLYPELKKLMDSQCEYEWEILFVNDGSKDNTITIIKDLRKTDERISYVNLSRNFGKENAMLAGIDYVIGDCMVIIDADLQDPPSLIPEMLKYWEEGYQDVYAKRADRGKESWLRKKMSLLFYKILDKSPRFDILQNVGDFRLLDRQCINTLKQLRETERYTKGLFCWIGYRKKEILFDRGNRVAGDSNWNLWSLFNLAIEGITSFTTAPLRIATISGFIIALCAFIYACTLDQKYTPQDVVWKYETTFRNPNKWHDFSSEAQYVVEYEGKYYYIFHTYTYNVKGETIEIKGD